MSYQDSVSYFTHGNTPEGRKAQIDNIRAKGTITYRSVKIGVNAFLISRDAKKEGFNLIGTPEQIAERIVHLKSIGVDLILSALLHFQQEVEYFGKRVLLLVHKLKAERLATF